MDYPSRQFLENYIHNLQQLHRATLILAIPEVSDSINESIAAAKRYLDFLNRNRLIRWFFSSKRP